MSLEFIFVAKVAFLVVLIDTNFINRPSASQLSVGFMQSGVMHRHPCKGASCDSSGPISKFDLFLLFGLQTVLYLTVPTSSCEINGVDHFLSR